MQPRIVPLRGRDHSAVLREALSVRESGHVPLIGDERWDEAAWRAAVERWQRVEVPPTTAWVTLTSGSTGAPKIVLRSRASWEHGFSVANRALAVRDEDVVLLPVHPVSSMTIFGAAHARARGIDFRTPRAARLTAEDVVGPTLMHATPSHLREVLDLNDAGAPTTLRSALIGGDRLDETLRRRAEDAGLRVVSYYGAAELSFVALDHGSGLEPCDGIELRVVEGRLQVRSPQAAIGVVDGAGELHRLGDWTSVGDRAELDANGRVHLRGREDGAILTAGATVVPADVEAALGDVPGVTGVLAVGVPHPRIGHLVGAYVECGALHGETMGREERATVERGVRNAAMIHLTPAQRPRRWRIVTALPRTGSGKVRRLTATEAERLLGPLGALDQRDLQEPNGTRCPEHPNERSDS